MVDSSDSSLPWYLREGGVSPGPQEAPREDADDGYGEDSVPTLPRLEAARDRSGDGSLTSDGVQNLTEDAIHTVCDNLKYFLIEKNRAYKNSAFEPLGVFSKLPPIEGFLLRLDDKLKRIKNGTGYPGDNDLLDATGYMILLMIKKGMLA